MMEEYQLRVVPQQAFSEQAIIDFLAKDKGIDARTITHVRILKRSIDARQRTVFVNLKVRVYINEPPQDDEYIRTVYPYMGDKPVLPDCLHRSN